RYRVRARQVDSDKRRSSVEESEMNKRLVYLIAPLAIAACGAADPPSASAQLVPPLAANMPVAITAPTAGSPVRGTVTVTASVSNPGPFGVTAVQFQLDG